jgi:hypothetical protein
MMFFNFFIWIAEHRPRADNADEHNHLDTGTWTEGRSIGDGRGKPAPTLRGKEHVCLESPINR